MVGDTGFNKNNQGVQPNYVEAYGLRTSWADLTREIAPYIDGDLRFLNLETVVTDQSLSLSIDKAFKFQSHPNSVRHMIENLGFNMMSLANNHSADYGREGLESTYYQMFLMNREYPLVLHGLGTLSELLQPARFNVRGVSAAFLSIGIDQFGRLNFPASESQIGSFTFRNSSWVNQAIENLRNSNASLKIVSLHYGVEGQTHISDDTKRVFRRFVDEAGANLVIGHHPHVVQPIEIYRDSLIAYSLGNFLLIGAANIGERNNSVDYGLILKARFEVNSEGAASVSLVRAVPIFDMHYIPYALDYNESRARLGVINHLNREAFRNPIEFSITREGEGIWYNN
jgi:poly-gamma-glutamate synthesis protein (capsule biosynthesis protein)